MISLVLIPVFIIFWTLMIIFGKKGDIRIEIFDINGKGTEYWGKFIIDKEMNTDKIQIKNKAKENIPMWREYFSTTVKKKDKLSLFRDSNGFLHPIKTVYDSASDTFKNIVDEKDMKFWYTQEKKDAIERWKKKKSGWEKAAPIIGYIIAALIMFMAIYFSSDSFNKATAAHASYLSQDMAIRQYEANVTSKAIEVLKSYDETKRKELAKSGVVNG